MISVKGTILLFFLLVVPLCLTILGTEPYPAIILPYGGGSYRQQDQKISVSYKVVYAANRQGQWQEIDPVSFMKPIPVQYFPFLAATNFGFDSLVQSHRAKRVYKFLGLQKKDRPKDKRELTDWLRKRLASHQMRDSTIRIVTYTETIATDTRKLLSKAITDERLIQLH